MRLCTVGRLILSNCLGPMKRQTHLYCLQQKFGSNSFEAY